MEFSNQYRTQSLAHITKEQIGNNIKVAGWVNNIRDHGGVLFIDVRDHYGVMQVVVYDDSLMKEVTRESVISVTGALRLRDPETINEKIATGTVELVATQLVVLGKVSKPLPFEVESSTQTKEEVRLKYRFLDLRNPKMQKNMIFRSQLISHLRKEMEALGFLEMQTPILSVSSPEGARDYLIPSRKHKGKFYALPQAPQIFKQLLMTSGFDKYFQIAPCFRDEDARADRSPGEFYQLDFEMAFATQEEVFRVAEQVVGNTFEKFSQKPVTCAPYPRISYRDAMLQFGTDKPDLRNPLRIFDLTQFFEGCDFPVFHRKTVRAITVPDCAGQSKGFFEKMGDFATDLGMKGLGFLKVDENGQFLGPIDKYLTDENKKELSALSKAKPGDVVFFIADNPQNAAKYAGQIRNELGARLNLIEDEFAFVFVVDFPMYEADEVTGELGFTHNPFSMPQGGLQALNQKDPLDILAYQYDIVCNGVELSSGAVRNHDIDTLVRAFEIAGYSKQVVKQKFGSLYKAFEYGAPPHAGMAPGVDRMIMLLCDEPNIREIIAFPLNANAQDLLMGSPTAVSEAQLREVHIKLR